MRKLYLAGILCSMVLSASSQDFTIKKTEIRDGKIVISYQLLDSTTAHRYTVSLYSSKDNYIAPLQKISGDFGLEVVPGGNKKIIWDVATEYGATYTGNIALEVRGRIYIPFIQFDGFKGYSSVKRGKEYEVTWTGGKPQNILNFELYNKDEKVAVFPNISNVGHYAMTLPTSVKPGKNYVFKITDTKNKDEIVYTQPFRVKRKVPLLYKAVPIVVIGGLAATAVGGSSSAADPSIVSPVDHPVK